jgi:hypothetical protein
MTEASEAAAPQGDGAPGRPVKALTLRIVSGLGSDEEVLELFARDLRPWLDQLPVDVTIVAIEDATEDERAERLGE